MLKLAVIIVSTFGRRWECLLIYSFRSGGGVVENVLTAGSSACKL